MICRRTLLSTATASLLSGLPAWGAAVPYVLDRATSEVRFTYVAGGAAGAGQIGFGAARVALDLGALGRSSVAVTLRADSIRAGFLPATEALRSPALLDSRNHPNITFESQQITPAGAGALVKGALSLRGVSRTETFRARYIGQVPPPDARRLGVQLDGAVDRRLYGITGFADFVAPEVAFRIRIFLERAA